MEIIILGNGGGINKGLNYNSFIIDEKYLCEIPPDIMYTLYKNKININEIETIFISHLHGDHIFGLPFLILELFYNSVINNTNKIIKIFGPEKIKYHAEQLLTLAFTDTHPTIKWMNENIDFTEIDENSVSSFIPDYNIEYFKLIHPLETYGFTLINKSNKNKEILFCYVADSLWDEKIKKILESNPKAVIIDLNGQKGEKHKVHISIDDLIEFALPITKNKTIYYGTHLKEEFEEDNDNIKCCRPGDVIKV